MRKQGKMAMTGRKNLKLLLEELATRDIESTEVKISQVISRQRIYHREPRQLNDASLRYSRPIRPDRLQSLSLKHQRHPSKDKENNPKAHPERAGSDVLDSITLDEGRVKAKAMTKKGGCSTARFSMKQHVKRKDYLVDLPIISPIMSKKTSFEDRNRLEEVQTPQRTDSEMLDYQLTPIEEEAHLTPARHPPFGIPLSKFGPRLPLFNDYQ